MIHLLQGHKAHLTPCMALLLHLLNENTQGGHWGSPSVLKEYCLTFQHNDLKLQRSPFFFFFMLSFKYFGERPNMFCKKLTSQMVAKHLLIKKKKEYAGQIYAYAELHFN